MSKVIKVLNFEKKGGSFIRTNRSSAQIMLSSIKKELIKTSFDVLGSEIKSKRFPDKFNTRVDGKDRKKIKNVSPLGKIEFIAITSLKKAMIDLMNFVERLAPVRTGRFKRNLTASILSGSQKNYKFAFRKEQVARYIDKENEKGKLRGISFYSAVPYNWVLEFLGVTSSSRGKKSFRKLKVKNRPRGVFKKAQRYFRKNIGLAQAVYSKIFKQRDVTGNHFVVGLQLKFKRNYRGKKVKDIKNLKSELK